mmetsp:Transcript_30153/g.60866  ORF Transcript_30153/g.60866 Transcript_30153/m.60866 type:complete len:90 (-) Transcript_30153:18-287(-)
MGEEVEMMMFVGGDGGCSYGVVHEGFLGNDGIASFGSGEGSRPAMGLEGRCIDRYGRQCCHKKDKVAEDHAGRFRSIQKMEWLCFSGLG